PSSSASYCASVTRASSLHDCALPAAVQVHWPASTSVRARPSDLPRFTQSLACLLAASHAWASLAPVAVKVFVASCACAAGAKASAKATARRVLRIGDTVGSRNGAGAWKVRILRSRGPVPHERKHRQARQQQGAAPQQGFGARADERIQAVDECQRGEDAAVSLACPQPCR